MTFFSVPRFITSIFSRSGVSTNGPFLSERLIATSSVSLNDELVRPLAVARLVSLGRQAPRRHRMPAAGGLAFAAAERVIDRVHRHAAHVRPLPQPAAAPGLADRDVLVIEVADLADRRVALDVDLANLARRHLHRRVLAFLGDHLHRRPGAARDLAALARLQLHVVDLRAERDVLQRQRVARQDVDVRARRRSCRRPSARSAGGCSASRRRRRSGARCAPIGSGRTRSSRPSPGCRACRA